MNFPLNRPERGLDVHTVRPKLPWGGSPFDEEGEGTDIRARLLPIWRRKWLILIIAFLGSALAVPIAYNMEKRFTASARVLFEPERLQIIDLDSVFVTPDETTGLQNQIEILRSETLMQRVIDTLRLGGAPEFNPFLRVSSPSYVELAVHKLGLGAPVLEKLAEFGLVTPKPPDGLTAEQQSERLRTYIINQLHRHLQLSPLKNTRVIEISYSSTDPVMAASITNAVAEQYFVLQAERKRDAIDAASETLSVRVQDLENRLETAEEAVRVAQLELTLDSKYGTTLITKQLETLNGALSEAQLERSALEEQHERISAAVPDQNSYAVVPELRESPAVSGYIAKEREVLEEIASLRSIVADEQSPQLIQLNARLERVRRDMRMEAQNVEKSLAMKLEAAQKREAGLQAELGELENRAVEHARTEMRIARLEREAQAARVMYDTFLSRMQEIREQSKLQTPDASFLARASVPLSADTTPRLLVVAAGGVAGIAAGIALIFIFEMLNNSFREPDQVETATGVPVLASVPMAGWRKRPRRLVRQVLRTPNSAFAESIRNLRTSLLFSNEDSPPKSVMFASSLPGEGKTTTALLLAVLSNRMGRSSLIVECDLRRQTLARGFAHVDPGKGLISVLEGRSTLDEAIATDPESGVALLAVGPNERVLKNPADLLSSDRFRTLTEDLKGRYDLVVFDAPPVLAVTDARVVAQGMDAIVYLIAWNKTPRQAVLHGIRQLASVNAKIAGCVLTRVSDTPSGGQLNSHFFYKRSYKYYAS